MALMQYYARRRFLRSMALKLRAIRWDSDIKPEFRHQFDLGMEWINLAAGPDQNDLYNSYSQEKSY